MSESTYTDIWLALADYKKRKVRKILDEIGAHFESEGDEVPDDDGFLHLQVTEANVFDGLRDLANLGIGFYAREDTRLTCEGDRQMFVAWRKNFIYQHEDGNGFPAIPMRKDGKFDWEDVRQGRQFLKMRQKVFDAARRKMKPTETAVQV